MFTQNERIEKLERDVTALKTKSICHHTYEEVGGVNTNYRIFYNMCNAYIKCTKCGHRERC